MIKTFAIALLAASLLTGCTAAKNLFKGNDDTVLPGERENVLPPEQQTARDPTVTGEQAAVPQAPADVNCDPNVSDCQTSVDQESAVPEGQ